MTDMDKIIEWVNNINRDIKSLEERIEKIGNTVLNTRYNGSLYGKITDFGRQMDKISQRILRLEVEKDGSST